MWGYVSFWFMAQNIYETAEQEMLAAAFQEYQEGNLKQAGIIYHQLLEQQPNHPEALNAMGKIAFSMGFPHDALDFMSRAIQSDPKECVFHSNRGDVYRMLERYEEALEDYAQALAIRSDHLVSLKHMAMVYDLIGEHDNAQKCYDMFDRMHPQDDGMTFDDLEEDQK